MQRENLLLKKQIELEKKMTQQSIDDYRLILEKHKRQSSFGCTTVVSKLLSRILDNYVDAITLYLKDYQSGAPVASTQAAGVISRLNDVYATAYISAKMIFNSIYHDAPIQRLYKAIGQAIEDEYKMRMFKEENKDYYTSIQSDLTKRGADKNRKKYVTMGVFNKRLSFHLDKWSVIEKIKTGLVLTRLFVESTGLMVYADAYEYKRKSIKHYKLLQPTDELTEWIEHMNGKLEVLSPFFLPMIYPPKNWIGIYEGGYISPYIKVNQLVKNFNRDYLEKLEKRAMPAVYSAINHIQATPWQINRQVLEVGNKLWEQGRAVAGLPDREDEALIPFPYPDKDTQADSFTDEEKEDIKRWKRETYEIHKRNVQNRSIRILTAQILKLANQFAEYDNIWFPYQMDFRGRLYPIPVLLQPQGTDLAKGLLRFSNGEPLEDTGLKWLEIHGANVWGYDKESYDDRRSWVQSHKDEFKLYANDPIEYQGWAEADKPFQFLAWCFEYNDYLADPDNFRTHLPIQLDGTCNGLQHYSALLRDRVGGTAVNLLNGDQPHDIYGVVAEKLKEKLNGYLKDNMEGVKSGDTRDAKGSGYYPCDRPGVDNRSLAAKWLSFGINRKLTKRPVMVLPYGGTLLSCREYIEEYLKDNYSPAKVWEHFGVGAGTRDCMYMISVWLAPWLWASIGEVLSSATKGMAYLRKIARILTKRGKFIEWVTPAGLLVRQSYGLRITKQIKTELYGMMLRTSCNIHSPDELDIYKQANGICPNFIHSLDAACLMRYVNKCAKAGITSIMSIHDCYGVHANKTELSAKLLREAFVEIYREPVLEKFTKQVLKGITIPDKEMPAMPEQGDLDIEEVLKSEYFFN